MAKKFLGSVGSAEAFRRNSEGKLELAFRSKTLTDSGINISTTKDEIRGGTGAPVQLVFCHDTTAEITLTDILFDEAYIQAQLGTNFEHGGEAYQSETLECKTAGQVELTYTPVDLPHSCGDELIVWFSKQGSDKWRVLDNTDEDNLHIVGKIVKDDSMEVGAKYCVRYIRYNDDAHIADIMSDFIPEELYLVITAPIFAGDACSASNGKKAGTITYEIPRFKLAGSLDIANNMSSNATMSLSGNALAADNASCDVNGARLVKIISVDENTHWYDECDKLELGVDAKVGGEVDIRGVFGYEVSTRCVDLNDIYVEESGVYVSIIDHNDVTLPSGETEYVYAGAARTIEVYPFKSKKDGVISVYEDKKLTIVIAA